MDDGIDPSQCLDPDAAAEIPKRGGARGAVVIHYTRDGRVQSCGPVLKPAVDHMRCEGWITDDEAHACETLVKCKLASLARHGAKTSRPDGTAT